MHKHLTAIIEREGQGYVSLCPELDIASQGDSIEEARVNLQEALELFSRSPRRKKSARAFMRRFTSPGWMWRLGKTACPFREGSLCHPGAVWVRRNAAAGQPHRHAEKTSGHDNHSASTE